MRSLQEWEEPLASRRRTAQTFQRYATLSAATNRLLEPDLSDQRRDEVLHNSLELPDGVEECSLWRGTLLAPKTACKAYGTFVTSKSPHTCLQALQLVSDTMAYNHHLTGATPCVSAVASHPRCLLPKSKVSCACCFAVVPTTSLIVWPTIGLNIQTCGRVSARTESTP